MTLLRPFSSACSRCEERQETGANYRQQFFDYEFENDYTVWNVEMAHAILDEKPRESHEMNPVAMAEYISNSHVIAKHTYHVDDSFPGIAVMLDGKALVIDGLHRAAKKLRKGETFSVYLLTEEESAQCLLIRKDRRQ